MLITEKDVGRKVRLRNGSIASISRICNYEMFPVLGFRANSGVQISWMPNGYYYADNNPSDSDIVSFIEDKIDRSTLQAFLETMFNSREEHTALSVLEHLADEFDFAHEVTSRTVVVVKVTDKCK